MGRILNWIQVQKTLKEKGFRVFTAREFAMIFSTSLISAQKFLERYTKKGIFLRPKKGIYLFDFNPAQEFIFANRIYSPSYVSLEAALSYYHLIPETVYAVTSLTTRPTREFEVAGRLFEYQKIKKEAFTGYQPGEFDGEIGLLATPEKALVDYLYFVSLGRKNLNDRLRISSLDFKKIINYTRLFQRKSLKKLANDLIKRA